MSSVFIGVLWGLALGIATDLCFPRKPFQDPAPYPVLVPSLWYKIMSKHFIGER